MTIHELIKKSGVNRRTIYYYIQLGLLPAPKGKGKSFVYNEEHLRRLEQIRKLQAQRYSLKEIKAMLEHGVPTLQTAEVGDAIESVQYLPISMPREVQPGLETVSELWRRFFLDDGVELLIRWPPDQRTLRSLESKLKTLITHIIGEAS